MAQVSILHPDQPLKGHNKWYGGIKGPDGAIYGMPYAAESVLRIDPTTEEVTQLGYLPSEDTSCGTHKWHGGILGDDGCIYAFPAHADAVLKVDPATGTTPISRAV